MPGTPDRTTRPFRKVDPAFALMLVQFEMSDLEENPAREAGEVPARCLQVCAHPRAPGGESRGAGRREAGGMPTAHLREFLGSPGPMLTCSTLLLGLRMARSPKPWWNCTCREPPALQGPQLSFFNLSSSLRQAHWLELTSQNEAVRTWSTEPSAGFCCWGTRRRSEQGQAT